jgi:putative MATE family efflux protein
MRNKNKTAILNDPIPPLLIRLTIPSIIGMMGLMIFNVVDTYFVGKLGSRELAAVSFTFPVVMVVGSLTMGLGIAVMSLFSRAAGQHDVEEERRLATSALILGVLVSVTISTLGYLSMNPLFTLLGVEEDMLPLVSSYMSIWYCGAAFVVLPMMGDSILRGLGDTRTPAFVMMTIALVNLVLDPLLIFGIGPFPALGIEGAAIATVFARLISALVSLFILHFRENLISFRGLTPPVLLQEWKGLFYLGLPNGAIKAIMPLGVGVFTSILARYGHETVAGYGVAAKIESAVFAFSGAMGVTATVFVGQNLGAGRQDRVRTGLRWIYGYGIAYGLVCTLVLALTGRDLASLFNEDSLVRSAAALYLLVVPAGYGLYTVGQSAASILNAYHKPMLAGGLSLFQFGLVGIPLSYILSSCMGEKGVFLAIGISMAALGLFSMTAGSAQSRKVLIPSESPV